ncbi:transposase, partial [Holospora curviuscula]
MNGVVYIIKTGCSWQMLPKDFPTYLTVHLFYRRC